MSSVAELVERSRREQNLPPRVEDLAVLRSVVELLRQPAERQVAA